MYAIQSRDGRALINGLGQVKLFPTREQADRHLADLDLGFYGQLEVRETSDARDTYEIARKVATHEFFCHTTGEIIKTSQPFAFCPSCGSPTGMFDLEVDDKHDLIEI